MKSIRAVYNRAAGYLGISFFTKDFMRFVRMHLLFSAAVNLSGIFLGIFLIRAGGTAADICVYYICAYAFEMAGNLFMPWLTSRFSQTVLSRVGMLMYLCSYLTLLVVQKRALSVFPLIALFGAVGGSLYWLPYHHFCVELTQPHTRQMAMSFMGLLVNFVVLVVPLVSGVITANMEGMSGYIVIFSISAVCFALGIFISRRLPAKKLPPRKRVLLSFFRKDFGRVSGVFSTNILYGIREGVYSYFFNLLIFSRIDSEFVLGLNVTARCALAILTFIVMGKVLTYKRRIRWNFYVLGAGVALSSLLLISAHAAIIMTVYILDAVYVTYVGNSLQFCTYEAADSISSPGESKRDVVMSVRNASLNLGRVLGIIGLLLVLNFSGDTLAVWPIVALNAIAALSAVTMWRAHKAMDKAAHG